MAKERYLDVISEIEKPLDPVFAFHSANATLVNGEPALASLQEQWLTPEGEARLRGRTPAILERDRILFSDQFRRQDDKHHVLFAGNERVSRSYTSHAIRVSHVARAVAGRLKLNAELAEAIALGSKVGGVPFLHVGKRIVDKWVKDQISQADMHAADRPKGHQQAALNVSVPKGGGGPELSLPDWIESIASPSVRQSVEKYLPWAKGVPDLPHAYSSGQQSYWELCLNPFLLSGRGRSSFMAQTMYGVWRHSLVSPASNNFEHATTIDGRAWSITEKHATHEGVVARYADDIAWVIENLNEASRAASLAGTVTPFEQLSKRTVEFPAPVIVALSGANPGALYSYFIDDLVSSTTAIAKAGYSDKIVESEPMVTLSPAAMNCLETLKNYLDGKVFNSSRLINRNNTLEVLLDRTLAVLYSSYEDVSRAHLDSLARKEGWFDDRFEDAIVKLDDSVHRIQACVSMVSSMSDVDVYRLIGLE